LASWETTPGTRRLNQEAERSAILYSNACGKVKMKRETVAGKHDRIQSLGFRSTYGGQISALSGVLTLFRARSRGGEYRISSQFDTPDEIC